MNQIIQKPHTFANLVAIMQDMQMQEKASVTWSMFNGHKVLHFKRQNARVLRDLDEKTAGLNELYVRKDDKGRPMVVIQPNGQGLLDFFDEEAKENYQKSYFEFLSTPINIIF